MNALYPVICARDVAASRDFYTALLQLDVVFDSDWYAQLQDPSFAPVQLGLVIRGHATVPDGFAQAPAGVLVTVEVDDADAVHERALAAGLPIPLPLRDEDFGQRHFMTVDPDGLLVDVVQIIPMRGAFAS
jgi:catechol 2,3-dioxygenase-like lactoylglutathione lyase family enzyme